MKRQYDFSKAGRNPHAPKLKRSVTLRLDEATIDYFKGLSAGSGIPFQTLINLYLRECAETRRQLMLEWRSAPRPPEKAAAQSRPAPLSPATTAKR